jgi:hypothetical protein
MPQFYKFLNDDLRHGLVVYKEGLNVDPLPFNPIGQCQPGGLYYTSLEHVPRWFKLFWTRIADVTVPDGARVYAEPCGTKWKADCLVLSNIRPVSEFLSTLDEATLCQMMSVNSVMLSSLVNQTEAVCLAAVRQWGQAVHYVHDQTEAVCLAAVKQDRDALAFIRNKTNAICLAAIEHDFGAIVHVPDPTQPLFLPYLQRNGCALKRCTSTQGDFYVVIRDETPAEDISHIYQPDLDVKG